MNTHTPGQVVESKCIKECGCRAGADREGYCDIDHCPLHAAAPEMLELLERVGRSACLDQRLQGQCICFSCEARNLITRATGRERG